MIRVLEMGHFKCSGTELWDAHISDTIGPEQKFRVKRQKHIEMLVVLKN